MNRTLIAIITAGLLASGAAVAGSVHSVGDNHSGNFIAVQYGYGYYGYGYDGARPYYGRGYGYYGGPYGYYGGPGVSVGGPGFGFRFGF